MSLHDDLLKQAEFLARKEPHRPKQVSLRRAVSAAYYALFHLLIHEASRRHVKDARLIALINRSYKHSQMSEVSKEFSRGKLPRQFDSIRAAMVIPGDLQDVARSFVELQQARHDADYDLSKSFTRGGVLILIQQASDAFEKWQKVRAEDAAGIYLACFSLWEDWNKPRRS